MSKKKKKEPVICCLCKYYWGKGEITNYPGCGYKHILSPLGYHLGECLKINKNNNCKYFDRKNKPKDKKEVENKNWFIRLLTYKLF